MMTVILVVVAIAAVPLGLLVPSWVETTQKSLQDRSDAEALRDASLLSSSVIVPSQITPWMLGQIQRMENATNPAEWNRTSFTEGPCNPGNLSQLPRGQYADAIAASCADMMAIQEEHASDCRSIQACNISSVAQGRLESVRANLLQAFSDAGFVLPYSKEEQPAGP